MAIQRGGLLIPEEGDENPFTQFFPTEEAPPAEPIEPVPEPAPEPEPARGELFARPPAEPVPEEAPAPEPGAIELGDLPAPPSGRLVMPDPAAENPFDQYFRPEQPTEEKSFLGQVWDAENLEWSDYGRAVMAGGSQVISGMGWLLEKLGEGADFLGAEWVGDKWMRSGRAVKDQGQRSADVWMNEHLDSIGITQKGLSEQAQRAMRAEFLGQADAGDKYNKAKMATMQSMFGTAAGMGAGYIAARGLMSLGVGSTKAAAIGYGAGEAAIAAPATGAGAEQEAREFMGEHSHEELMDGSPAYEATWHALSGITDKAQREAKARDLVARATGGEAAAYTAVSTFLLSAPFGRLMEKMTTGVPLATTRLRSTMSGAAGEAGQEFLQSGAEAMSENLALMGGPLSLTVDQKRTLMEGALENAVGGSLSGAMMGGVVGGVAGPEVPGEGPLGPTDALERLGDITAPTDMDVQPTLPGVPEAPVDPQMELFEGARQEAAAAGGDLLDQTLAGSQAAAEYVGSQADMFDQQLALPLEAEAAPEAAPEPVGPEAGMLEQIRATQEQQEAQRAEEAAAEQARLVEETEQAERAERAEQQFQELRRARAEMGLAPPTEEVEVPPAEPPTEAVTERVPTAMEAAFERAAEVAPPAVEDREESKGIDLGTLPAPEASRTLQDVIEAQAATAPENELPEPTEAQIEAGNYPKAHVNVQGLQVSVENAPGSVREGVDPTGKAWSQEMKNPYGYVKGTEGRDGDQVDVFLGDQMDAPSVFVVDQLDQESGQFDEHKALVGFPNQLAAVKAYKANYEKGWKVGPITEMPMEEFKTWVNEGVKTQPIQEMPQPLGRRAWEEQLGEAVEAETRRTGRQPKVRFAAPQAEAEPVTPDRAVSPTFYSQMARAIEAKMPAKMPKKQFKTLIQNMQKKGDLKKEEAEWYEIDKAIEDMPGDTVTKEQVLDYIEYTKPPLRTEDLAAKPEEMTEEEALRAQEEGLEPARYSNPSWRTILGGKNYREVLTYLPRKLGVFESRYVGRHYDDRKNVLAWSRVADFETPDGETVLFAYEMQSDWHQQGRKYGYRDKADPNVPSVEEEVDAEMVRVFGEEAHTDPESPAPDAPFKKNWPLLQLKTLISRAVAEGQDFVAWSTGAQQNKTWDLRKTVGKVTYSEEYHTLSVLDTHGDIIYESFDAGPESLDKVLGKGLADAVRAQEARKEQERNRYNLVEGQDNYWVTKPNGDYLYDINGQPLAVPHPQQMRDRIDLYGEAKHRWPFDRETNVFMEDLEGHELGGEGMLSFYDNTLVNTANKYIKKLGSRVEEIQVKTPKYPGAEVVHGFPVTDKMRKMVLKEGQPRFKAPVEEVVKPMTVEGVTEAVAAIVNNLPRIQPQIVDSIEDLPVAVKNQVKAKGFEQTPGMYDPATDTMYLVAENLSTPEQAIKILLHEGVAHKGLAHLYPNEAEFDEVMRQVFDKADRAGLERTANEQELDMDSPEDQLIIAEEYIASLAETQEKPVGILRQAIAAVRAQLRRLGIVQEFSDNDIRALLAKTRRALKGRPLDRTDVLLEAEVEETGEAVTIRESALVAIRQLDKRISVCQKLQECLSR